MACTYSCTESASDPISTAVGATISTAAVSEIKVAARPCLSPSLRASIWCRGYKATARISAQTISVRNGAKIL